MVYEQIEGRLTALQDADTRERYARLLGLHRQHFRAGPLYALSAPGRAEIIGNHTDHNRGRVLAAAINLDTAAVVSPREDLQVRLFSEGYGLIELGLDNLKPGAQQAGSSAALSAGVAEGLVKRGYSIGGFDAVVGSQVLSGSGLSSSAAIEVLVCYIFDVLFNGSSVDFISRAQIGQYAENVHFGKPSGLMDQMASSSGGLVAIDFREAIPQVDTIRFSYREVGYAMVIVNTGGSHDNLTEAYAAIPREMKAAAAVLGGETLSEVPFETFTDNLRRVREEAGDRALLRALHFYQENRRVAQAADALREGNLPAFFKAVNESGLSSETQLQNIHVNEKEQPMALALALARETLRGQGACRVHGGGFAGTTLNFVPLDMLEGFTHAMEALFGPGCCHSLDVRLEGPARIF